MLPQSGRAKNATYDPDDTWDKYVPPSNYTPKPLPTEERSTFAPGDPRSSEEAIVKAFAQSNAMRALSEEIAPFDPGRKMVRMQHANAANDSYNPNILPTPITPAACIVDQYYVGGLGVEERYRAGSFTDRLGNEFEVWESQMPPPDKDYSTIAPNSSRRNLERCMGGDPAFADRPKREAKGEINPAEPRGDAGTMKERRSVAELKGRQTFFNQNGMQPESAFDTGRDNYDGYNVKTDYSKRVVPVEPCWRASNSSETRRVAESQAPGPSVHAAAVATRKPEDASFLRTPARHPVSVRSAQIGLPFVKQASLQNRSAHAEAEQMGAHSSEGLAGPRMPRTTDHADKVDHGHSEPVRPALSSTARYNPVVHANNDDSAYTTTGLSQQGPVQFSVDLTDVERREVHRENAMVEPKASHEWHIRQRIVDAAFEREGEDDAEVCAINQNVESIGQPVPREGADHAGGDAHAVDAKQLNAQGVLQPAPREGAEHVGGDAHALDTDGIQNTQGAHQAAPRMTVQITGEDATEHNIRRQPHGEQIGKRPRPAVAVERVDVVRAGQAALRAQNGGVDAASARVEKSTREGHADVATDHLQHRDVIVHERTADADHTRTGNEVFEIHDRVRHETVIKQATMPINVTRAGGDPVEYERQRRTNVVVHGAAPKTDTLTRPGRAQMTQPLPANQQLASRSVIASDVRLNEDREMVDDTEMLALASRVPSRPCRALQVVGESDDYQTNGAERRGVHGVVEDKPAHASPYLPATHRQHAGQTGNAVREVGSRVGSQSWLPNERVHVTVPVQRGRSLGGRVSTRADSLPVHDRACIPIVGHRDHGGYGSVVRTSTDMIETNRTVLLRTKVPTAFLPMGKQVSGAVESNLGPESVREHFGAPARDGSAAHVRERGDRPDGARASFGTRDPANPENGSGVAARMRPKPPVSSSSGGMTETTRVGSRASASTPLAMMQSTTRLADDRSTPTRAVLAGRSTDARWTPTVQMDSSRGQVRPMRT